MKKWNAPVVEELDMKATAYHELGGTKVDGEYNSYDGTKHQNTYGPSTGNSGEPETVVH